MDYYFLALCIYGVFLVIYFSAKYKFSLGTFLVLGFVILAVLMLSSLLGYFTMVHKTV